MLENNLYQVIKKRMLDEMNDSLRRHPVYRGDVKAYGKYHMGKERPQVGVSLVNVGSNRETLSPDDTLGDLISMVVATRVGNCPGTSIEWVWENSANISKYVKDEIATGTISSDRMSFTTNHPYVTEGPQSPNPASNVGQIRVYVGGRHQIPRSIEADIGRVVLYSPVPANTEVLVSYYYKDVDPPGFYFIEILDKTSFIMTPMFSVEEELVASKVTGTETTLHLVNTPVLVDYVLSLYLRWSPTAPRVFLDRNVDYTILEDGTITLLTPLPAGYSLYASYRWRGANKGPYTIDGEYSFNTEAIKGVVLAFGSRVEEGDKVCVVFTDKRERCAQVKGGHYIMNFEWKVFSRDPMTTSEITDHLVSDIWAFRKEPLRSEGITIQDCTGSGEAESSYDDATQAMYFESTISMEIRTEWKLFIPYILKLKQYRDLTQYHHSYGNTEIINYTTIRAPELGYPTIV
jgi:hypothetical protein